MFVEDQEVLWMLEAWRDKEDNGRLEMFAWRTMETEDEIG